MIGDINKESASLMLKDVNDKIRDRVAGVLSCFSTIKWRKVSFTIPTVPVPSHRPRLCGYRVYVPGAAKNQSFFNRHVRPKLNGLFITTPCKITVDIYCKTPKSFTKTQQILAEMGVIRPWFNSGDVDNFDKSVYDMMQPNEKRGHVGIMSNDCLIIESHSNKYYSKNPRYEVTIAYMDNIPDSILSTLRLKDKI
jgi:Holliday junction resolvase RusA-like endonuclease